MITKKKYMLTFVAVILLIMTFCFAGCNPKELPILKEKLKDWDEFTTRETEEAIKRNPELQELDNLCKQIPLSERFKLYSKRMASHGPPALFLFYYSEDDFDKSDKLFREYFKQNGWEIFNKNSMNRISEFRKNNYIISIQYGGVGQSANYAISCEKTPSLQ